jgi:hypothetical protein
MFAEHSEGHVLEDLLVVADLAFVLEHRNQSGALVTDPVSLRVIPAQAGNQRELSTRAAVDWVPVLSFLHKSRTRNRPNGPALVIAPGEARGIDSTNQIQPQSGRP